MLLNREHYLVLASHAISDHLHAFLLIFRIWRQKMDLETSKKLCEKFFLALKPTGNVKSTIRNLRMKFQSH